MQSNKIMVYATIAMALGAAIQGVVAFQQFAHNQTGKITEIGVLIVLGLFVVIAGSLAFKSYTLINEKRESPKKEKKKIR